MKTKEEPNTMNNGVEALDKKPTELTNEELGHVSGGNAKYTVKGYFCNNPQCDAKGKRVTPPSDGNCQLCGEKLAVEIINRMQR